MIKSYILFYPSAMRNYNDMCLNNDMGVYNILSAKPTPYHARYRVLGRMKTIAAAYNCLEMPIS